MDRPAKYVSAIGMLRLQGAKADTPATLSRPSPMPVRPEHHPTRVFAPQPAVKQHPRRRHDVSLIHEPSSNTACVARATFGTCRAPIGDCPGPHPLPSLQATWEDNADVHGCFPASDDLSAVHAAATWQTQLRSRRRRSMPGTSTSPARDAFARDAAAPGVGMPHPSPPNTSHSTAESHISMEARSVRLPGPTR